MIEMSKSTLMNSKSEWHNSRIPRIVIETGEDQLEDQESGLGRSRDERETSNKAKRGKVSRGVVRNPKRGGELMVGGEEPTVEKRRKVGTDEGGEKVTSVSKKLSRGIEVHRREIQEKKKRDQCMRMRCETKEKKEERSGLGYWKSKFSEMAEKNRSKTIEVRGAKEHITRIEKGRVEGEKTYLSQFEKSKLTGGLTQGESRPTELEKIKEEENSLPVNAEKCEDGGMGEEFMRDEDDLILLEEMDRMLKCEKARQKTSECNKLREEKSEKCENEKRVMLKVTGEKRRTWIMNNNERDKVRVMQ